MGSIVGVSIVALWVGIPVVAAFRLPKGFIDKWLDVRVVSSEENWKEDLLLWSLIRALLAVGGMIALGAVSVVVSSIVFLVVSFCMLLISTLGFWLPLWLAVILLACIIPSFFVNKYLRRKVRSGEARERLRPYLEQARRELADEFGGDTIEKAFAKLEREVART